MVDGRKSPLIFMVFLFNGEYVFMIIDECNHYPEVEVTLPMTAKLVISTSDAAFARHGILKVGKRNNGLLLNGEIFTKWVENIEFWANKTRLWPRTNGLAEGLLDTLEKIIKISHAQKDQLEARTV